MLAGTASPDTVKVTWQNDRGGSGVAVGTASWSVPTGVPLQPGDQVVTVFAEDAAGNVGTAQLRVTYDTGGNVIATPTDLKIVDSGLSVDGMAIFQVSWTPVPGAVTYPYTCAFSDDSGSFPGSSANPSFTLKLPYHVDGLAASAWFCVSAKDATGAVSAESLCDSFTVPAKPILPTNLPAPKAVFITTSVAFTGTPPDATGGWSMQLFEGTIALAKADAIAPFVRTLPLKSGPHLIYAMWTKSGVVKKSDPVRVVCP